MKIKANRTNCYQFLHEIIDEFGEASSYYGMRMDRPGEELAAEDYERCWRKVQTAMKILFKTELEAFPLNG